MSSYNLVAEMFKDGKSIERQVTPLPANSDEEVKNEFRRALSEIKEQFALIGNTIRTVEPDIDMKYKLTVVGVNGIIDSEEGSL